MIEGPQAAELVKKALEGMTIYLCDPKRTVVVDSRHPHCTLTADPPPLKKGCTQRFFLRAGGARDVLFAEDVPHYIHHMDLVVAMDSSQLR